jgi:hypothetical protein
MGAVYSNQQPKDEAALSDSVGSVDNVNNELPIFGVGHRNYYKLRPVYGDYDDGGRDSTRQ